MKRLVGDENCSVGGSLNLLEQIGAVSSIIHFSNSPLPAAAGGRSLIF